MERRGRKREEIRIVDVIGLSLSKEYFSWKVARVMMTEQIISSR